MKMFAQRQKAGMDGLLKIENIPPPPHVIVIKQDTQTELTSHSSVILWLAIKKVVLLISADEKAAEKEPKPFRTEISEQKKRNKRQTVAWL